MFFIQQQKNYDKVGQNRREICKNLINALLTTYIRKFFCRYVYDEK